MWVLKTINDLQDHHLGLLTSRSRQCRLGYDSSPQCDSRQLGEFIQFLTRIGTLQLRGTIEDATPNNVSIGDIRPLIGSLHQCPAYQVDSNHSHCGPKKQFMLGLDFIQFCLQDQHIGICLECWENPKLARTWSESKHPLTFDTHLHAWSLMPKSLTSKSGGCEHNRSLGHDFFTAVERRWTFDGNVNGVTSRTEKSAQVTSKISPGTHPNNA